MSTVCLATNGVDRTKTLPDHGEDWRRRVGSTDMGTGRRRGVAEFVRARISVDAVRAAHVLFLPHALYSDSFALLYVCVTCPLQYPVKCIFAYASMHELQFLFP